MSTIIDFERHYTPEELQNLPDADHYELVDGHLVEPRMSTTSSRVTTKLIIRVGQYSEASQLGEVFESSNMYRCFPHRPNIIRKPDLSFIRRDRFRSQYLEQNILTIAPDLAVEVISPNDDAEDLEIKVFDYLKAGVQLVWLIFPIARLGRVHQHDGLIKSITEDQVLDGLDVLPGFQCQLSEVLLPPLNADGSDQLS